MRQGLREATEGVAGIIWLASYQKSGNTWVRAFLANLLRNPDRPLPINELPKFALGDGFLIHFETLSGKSASELTATEFHALRPQLHEWFAQSSPDNAFVKTHNACVSIEGQPLITPTATAGAVYVLRNPLDVVVSFAHHHQIGLQEAVDRICDDRNIIPASSNQREQYLLSWSTHVNSWLKAPGLKCHVLRYEDMRASPQKAFGGLVKFLGLPDNPARLKKAIRFSSFKELSGQEREERFVESRPDGKSAFFRQGKVGAWRDALSEAQVEKIVESQGEVMKAFGYLDRKGRPKD